MAPAQDETLVCFAKDLFEFVYFFPASAGPKYANISAQNLGDFIMKIQKVCAFLILPIFLTLSFSINIWGGNSSSAGLLPFKIEYLLRRSFDLDEGRFTCLVFNDRVEMWHLGTNKKELLWLREEVINPNISFELNSMALITSRSQQKCQKSSIKDHYTSYGYLLPLGCLENGKYIFTATPVESGKKLREYLDQKCQ